MIPCSRRRWEAGPELEAAVALGVEPEVLVRAGGALGGWGPEGAWLEVGGGTGVGVALGELAPPPPFQVSVRAVCRMRAEALEAGLEPRPPEE